MLHLTGDVSYASSDCEKRAIEVISVRQGLTDDEIRAIIASSARIEEYHFYSCDNDDVYVFFILLHECFGKDKVES